MWVLCTQKLKTHSPVAGGSRASEFSEFSPANTPARNGNPDSNRANTRWGTSREWRSGPSNPLRLGTGLTEYS